MPCEEARICPKVCKDLKTEQRRFMSFCCVFTNKSQSIVLFYYEYLFKNMNTMTVIILPLPNERSWEITMALPYYIVIFLATLFQMVKTAKKRIHTSEVNNKDRKTSFGLKFEYIEYVFDTFLQAAACRHSLKQMFLKISQYSMKRTVLEPLFNNIRTCNCITSKYCEIFKNIFFTEQLPTTASDILSYLKMFDLQFTGCDGESFGFGGTGKKSTNRQFDTYGEVGILYFFKFLRFLKME